MGLLKELITSAYNYYNPPGKSLTGGIRNYEWFNFDSRSSDVIRTENDYRSFAYACINVRAEKALTAELALQAIKADGDYKPVKSHPFLDLIRNPNRLAQSFSDIMFMVMVSLDLFKQGAFIYVVKDMLGIPREIYYLPSQCVTFELTADATQIKRYIYTNGLHVQYYLPEEIIHFKLPNPYRNGLFWSAPTAAACKFTLDADFYQSLYSKRFYENNAALGMIFTMPIVNGRPITLGEDEYNRLDNRIREKYSSPENAGKHFLAEGGIQVDRGDATPREADYSKTRIATKDEICGIFRVPKAILGFVDDVNRANMEASMSSFLKNTIMPFANLHIWGRFDQWVKINYDERLYLKANYQLEESRETVLAEYEAGVNKWLRPNEIRTREGLPEDWDKEADEKQITNIKEDNGKTEEPADTEK